MARQKLSGAFDCSIALQAEVSLHRSTDRFAALRLAVVIHHDEMLVRRKIHLAWSSLSPAGIACLRQKQFSFRSFQFLSSPSPSLFPFLFLYAIFLFQSSTPSVLKYKMF
jgi:hypothetical protein